MCFLTKKKTGGNLHDNGTIEITSNSIISDPYYHPKNLVDYQQTTAYKSSKNTESIVCFDFKDQKIQPTSYSIRSSNSHVLISK